MANKIFLNVVTNVKYYFIPQNDDEKIHLIVKYMFLVFPSSIKKNKPTSLFNCEKSSKAVKLVYSNEIKLLMHKITL